MIGNLTTAIGETLSGVLTAFVGGVGELAKVFVTVSETGQVTDLSILGYFVAFGLGASLLGAVIAFVRRIIKNRI